MVIFLTLLVLDPAAAEEPARLGLDFLLEVGGCDRLPEGFFEDLGKLFRGRDDFLAACLAFGAPPIPSFDRDLAKVASIHELLLRAPTASTPPP